MYIIILFLAISKPVAKIPTDEDHDSVEKDNEKDDINDPVRELLPE